MLHIPALRLRTLLFVLSCVLARFVIGPASAQTDTPCVDVWVTPDPDADLASLRDAIRLQGGKLLTLAPERRLLVRYRKDGVDSVHRLSGVAAAQTIEVAAEPQGSLIKGLGALRPTADKDKQIRAAFTRVERVDAEQLSLDRAALQMQATAPAQVDNSVSIYFPPIRSQGGQGSCTAWAASYYYSTYTQARDENINVSGGDNNNICSPAFIYNLTNWGNDNGAYTTDAVERLDEVGASSWALMPYSQSDYTTWPTEQAWVDALKRRTLASYSIGHWYYGCSDTQLAAIKQHLANGNIAVTETDVYANFYYYYPNNTTGINNGVLFASSGSLLGGHALTIVGYDDNKSYYDGSTTRYGAFLIANSWGSGWGVYNTATTSKGFMWVAYDYFKAANGCFGVAYYNSDRDNYRPRLYAVSGLNHTQRGYVSYAGGVGSPYAPLWSSYSPISLAGGTSLSVTDAKRIAVDLTDGIGTIALPNVQLFVKMSVYSSASGGGTITSAVFYHDFDADGSFVSVTSTDPTVTVPVGQSRYATVDFTYPSSLSLGEALDDLGLTWTTGGDASWFGSMVVTHDGHDAAQSGDVRDSEETWFQTTVIGPGTASFWWKVSSEAGWDWLEFYVDGERIDRNSGEVDWEQVTVAVGSGSHTLKWRYVKDGSVSSGSDCGWVDQVVFIGPGPGADILLRESDTGEVVLWMPQGLAAGPSTTIDTVPPVWGWVIQGVADLDGNGKADIVLRNAWTGQVAGWLMDGATRVSHGAIGTLSTQWAICGFGDFDGDTKADILWHNASTGEIRIWFCDGLGIGAQGSPYTIPPSWGWEIQATGDFDNDGKDDIVLRNRLTGMIVIWLMNGSAIKGQGSPHTIPPAWGWEIQATGDFDADGKSDIVLRNAATGMVAVWLMNGTAIGSQGSPHTIPPDWGWDIQGTGDFDNDGKDDIVLRNRWTGMFSVWLMDGTAIRTHGSPGTWPTSWGIEGVGSFSDD